MSSMKFLSAVGLALALFTGSANAEEPFCASWNAFKKVAKESWKETPTGDYGMINEKNAVTLFTSQGGETWTLAVVNANGRACVLLGGVYWGKSPVEGSAQ